MIYVTIGLAIVVIVLVILLCRKKQQDQNIAEQIHQEEIRLGLLQNQVDEVLETLTGSKVIIAQLEQQKKSLEEQISLINTHYEQIEDIAAKNLDLELEQIVNNFDNQKEEYQSNYLNMMQECASECSTEISTLTNELNRLKSLTAAALAEYERNYNETSIKEKFKLNPTETDLQEIKKLREVIPYMRDGRPICKAIWESYYRQLTTDLLSRIIDSTSGVTGIYKITNLNNQKCYIGQALDLNDRLKTHIKCGIGIDTPNSNLYKALLSDGVENFSYEIIEYCNRNDLNDREKFWIEYFNSQSFGYNMTSGGSATR